jgi:hypothetical protein
MSSIVDLEKCSETELDVFLNNISAAIKNDVDKIEVWVSQNFFFALDFEKNIRIIEHSCNKIAFALEYAYFNTPNFDMNTIKGGEIKNMFAKYLLCENENLDVFNKYFLELQVDASMLHNILIKTKVKALFDACGMLTGHGIILERYDTNFKLWQNLQKIHTTAAKDFNSLEKKIKYMRDIFEHQYSFEYCTTSLNFDAQMKKIKGDNVYKQVLGGCVKNMEYIKKMFETFQRDTTIIKGTFANLKFVDAKGAETKIFDYILSWYLYVNLTRNFDFEQIRNCRNIYYSVVELYDIRFNPGIKDDIVNEESYDSLRGNM